jgi:hypothetical protein
MKVPELIIDFENKEVFVCFGVLNRFFCCAENSSSLDKSPLLAWKMLDFMGVIIGDWINDLLCLVNACEATCDDHIMLWSWSLHSLVSPE